MIFDFFSMTRSFPCSAVRCAVCCVDTMPQPCYYIGLSRGTKRHYYFVTLSASAAVVRGIFPAAAAAAAAASSVTIRKHPTHHHHHHRFRTVHTMSYTTAILMILLLSSSSSSFVPRWSSQCAVVIAFQPPLTTRTTTSSSGRRSTSSQQRRYVVPLQTEEDSSSTTPKAIKDKKDDDGSSSTTSNSISPQQAAGFPAPLLDWNASGSIGSLLMQMQKKEEEMRKFNKTLLDRNQAVDLSLHNSTTAGAATNANTATSRYEEEERQKREDEKKSGVGVMDASKAKELDDSISLRLSSSPGKDVQILELPALYKVLQEREVEEDIDGDSSQEQGNAATKEVVVPEKQKDDWPSLSRPKHYEDRIGRDMRQLAVSIASCIDNTAEYKTYCEQIRGGIYPLVECIREGANAVRQQRGELRGRKERKSSLSLSSYATPDLVVSSQHEERFLAASSACRALRDLCGISVDLAVVITDSLLRANVGVVDTNNAPRPSLMEDLVTLLRYAHDADINVTPATRRRGLLWLRRRNQPSKWKLNFSQNRREARLQCKLYVLQLLLTMSCSSDSAVDALRSTEGLRDGVLRCSSYARVERTRRWLRYPGEMIKSFLQKGKGGDTAKSRRRPFIEATSVKNDLNGKVQGTANQILAAMGYNEWIPKIPGQKGLRILCLDGGGSRGMTSVIAVNEMVKSLGGVEVADCFDLVVGTSTGAIIAFLIGLKRETSEQAVARYDVLIPNIFTKTALSTPLLLFTTATYDESPFMNVLCDILGDQTMLDSRADPAVPYVFAVTSKMSSTPTHVALFRNYNYNGGELPDPFVVKPEEARDTLRLGLEYEDPRIQSSEYPKRPRQSGGAPWRRQQDGSRHPGSFRVLQRYALRASTAAPTVFKPVLMGGEMYCDGGIVASNPTAIAVHEARTLFPDVPIELVVSIGTGGFLEQKSAPRIGWDGIIAQIVDSACDGEQIHHILEDILGEGGTKVKRSSSISNTQYMRFNPILGFPDDFPIDITDPKKLELIKQITRDYMNAPEQKRKLEDLADLLQGREGFRKRFRI